MSRSVKITRSGAELRGGGRAAAGQIVHMLDAEADVLVDRGEATELNTISQAIMPTPANGDVLTYVTSDGQWENKPTSNPTDPTFASLHVTGGTTIGPGTDKDITLSGDGVSSGLWMVPQSNANAATATNLNLTGGATSHPQVIFATLDTQGDRSTANFDGSADIAFAYDHTEHSSQLNIDCYDDTTDAVIMLIHGKIGLLTNEPAAPIHLAGDTLIDGNVGFNGANPSQPTLATGAGATVDQVIAALQALGLVKQS